MKQPINNRRIKKRIRSSWLWVIIVLLDLNIAVADCAFVHLENNYLFSGEELKGTLYTNACTSIFPQVIISLLDQENQSVTESWIRLDASLQPFELNVPANINEGIYRLVVFTPRSMEILYSRDLPVFKLDPGFIHGSEVGGDLGGAPLKPTKRGLSVKWDPLEPGGMLVLEIAAEPIGNDPVYVSLKISDKAQSIADDLPPETTGNTSEAGDAIPLSSHTFALEGYLSDSSGTGCSFCQVILTIPTLERGIYYTKTDDTGSFVISGLSHTGSQKGYLSYQPDQTAPPKRFFIHERKTAIKPVPSKTSFEVIKNKLAPQLYRNLLTASLRNGQWPSPTISSEEPNRPYQDILLYSKSDIQVLFDEYYLDSDMKGIIKSIIPLVNIIKKHQLRVFSNENRSNFSEAPFILLDGIPIDSKIALSIDPRTIYKVEVLHKGRTLRQIGNLAANGVIAFFSKNGTDETRLVGVQKIYIKGFDNKVAHRPNSQPAKPFAKVLYWSPSIEIKSGETFTPSISLPDYYIELLVSIIGYDSQGKLIYFQDEIIK